jgi:hypothetical protein
MSWWKSLSEKTRWILFIPASILIMFFVAIVAQFSIPNQDGKVVKLVMSAVNMVTFFWSITYLPPRRNVEISWGFFAFLTAYLIYSTSYTLKEENVFGGGTVPQDIGSFWIIQNFVWIISAFVSVLVFTRAFKKHQGP